mgnify:CR=1 FL=1
MNIICSRGPAAQLLAPDQRVEIRLFELRELADLGIGRAGGDADDLARIVEGMRYLLGSDLSSLTICPPGPAGTWSGTMESAKVDITRTALSLSPLGAPWRCTRRLGAVAKLLGNVVDAGLVRGVKRSSGQERERCRERGPAPFNPRNSH